MIENIKAWWVAFLVALFKHSVSTMNRKIENVDMLWIVALLSLCGCAGTVTPNHVMVNVASIDSSIPPQYDQSVGWLLKKVKEKGVVTGGVITKNARDRYNYLIEDYAIQYKALHHELLFKDKGVIPWKDKWGNDLFIIDAQHLEAYGIISQMEKDQMAPDSAWQKLKNAL